MPDDEILVIDYEKEMPPGLRHHLDSLANSCAYYYDALVDRGMDETLSADLVLSWHDSKVGAWRDLQSKKFPRDLDDVDE